MKIRLSLIALVLAGLGFAGRASGAATAAADRAENVIVVTIDGLRWQEVFGGAEAGQLAAANRSVRDTAVLRARYLRPTAEARRERLMPFLWSVVAKDGQVFGDRSAGCVAAVENPHRVSYPGYSELTAGFVDPRIKNNADVPNPNATVFEWLHGRPGYAGRVAAFGAWGRLHALINPDRSGIFCMAGWRPIPVEPGKEPTPVEVVLNEMLSHDTRLWPDEPPDVYCQTEALDYIRRNRPRVVYVMLGETDEWAHADRYDLYLESAGRSDAFVRRLWELVQSTPQYAGKTALLLTCDHGRGEGKEWTSHGEDVVGADGTWIAVMGPGVPAAGVRRDVRVTQSQVAGTIAGLVGEDYNAAVPKAAKPLPGVLDAAGGDKAEDKPAEAK